VGGVVGFKAVIPRLVSCGSGVGVEEALPLALGEGDGAGSCMETSLIELDCEEMQLPKSQVDAFDGLVRYDASEYAYAPEKPSEGNEVS